jgi:phosphoribosylamine--glycine ligase
MAAAAARAAAAAMLGGSLGAAGRTVVIERRLRGREASVLAITDGERFVILPPAEDHKAVFDGDRGPNTGGMGAFSPTPVVTLELYERVARDVLAPTVAALRAEGIDYRGVLYAGVMLDDDGAPQVLEYNCRFGDPEAEVIFARWADDPAPWLAGAAAGRLPDDDPHFSPEVAVCVVLAAAGYPGPPRTGDRIDGVAEASAAALVFQAGTRQDGGELVTAGGRVLAVTALGRDLATARDRAYGAVARIHFDGVHYRRDIGGRT